MNIWEIIGATESVYMEMNFRVDFLFHARLLVMHSDYERGASASLWVFPANADEIDDDDLEMPDYGSGSDCKVDWGKELRL